MKTPEIVIDGEKAVAGRLASYVAKQALQGSSIVILNAEKVMITGNKKFTKENYLAKRGRVGSGQRGPKHSQNPEKILKRIIRGMLPNHREGRGREAFKRIKCYLGVPEAYQHSHKIVGGKEKGLKYTLLGELSRSQ